MIAHWSRTFYCSVFYAFFTLQNYIAIVNTATHDENVSIVTRNEKIVWKLLAELAAIRTYVENQAILEPIFLYWASKCKQTKEQDSVVCLWTHICTFL